MNRNYKNKILCLAAICAACGIMNPAQAEYGSLYDALKATANPRMYTLTDTEISSVILGNMGGSGSTLTVDGGSGNYGINNTSADKDTRIYVGSGQTLNLQNLGTYTTTTSDSIIAGKSVITDVIVSNSVNNFGVVAATSANSSYVGFLRSAGTSNVTNSVFYNNEGLYGSAIQNRENGELSVKNSVFVGNVSQHSAIHNDSNKKITDISDSIFYNNTAEMVTGSGNSHTASAIFNKATRTIDLITGSTFTNNIATGDSTNIAATVYNAGTIGTITDSIFYNNTSENKGSVIYNAAAGVITTISDSHFVNNTANSGILETIGSISNITDSTFKGNTVTKNGIIALYNDTAASTIGIGNINKVQVTDNTGNGIYIRAGKSDATVNITSITGESKFNNNTGSGLYIGGNSGIINITSINNSEFNNNAQRGLYIQNNNSSNSGQITITEISNVKINGNQDGGIYLQRNGENTLQINEISNVEIKDNTRAQTDAQGAGLRNEGAHIVKMSNVIFDNDTLGNTTKGPQGGAIYNSQYGTIDEMKDITIQNCTAYNGGAIYNVGTIGSIVNMTVSDINTSDVMIATEGDGYIGTIDNMTIQNSAGTGLSFYGATGGTIKNSTFTNMYGPGAKMGYGLQVTAKANTQTAPGIDGHVNIIDNIIVAGNQTGGMRIDDNGGTSVTANVGLIKNSQFTNNGTTGNNKAGGIWAKTDVLTISADGAGKTTTFKRNKRQGVATGIYMENKNSILNLQQLNSGEMYMYDPIKGTGNRYYVNISGDNTGTIHLYDDIVNGMVDIQNTHVDTIDGKIHNYNFSTLSSDTNSKYTLDIFFDKTEVASTIDKFTISNVSLEPETSIIKATAGKITLKALNFLNDVDASMVGKSATLQIINAPAGNTLGLVNGFELAPGGYVLFTLQDDVKTEYDPIVEDTDWSTKVKIYDIATKVLGDVEIQTTATTDDTLKITIAESTKSKTWTGNYLDTLLAVNQAALDTRNFTTDTSSAVYNVTSDLGETAAGNFNIKGKDSEYSLIDFNETEHYKGFELNNDTNLTLENVEIKNSYQLVSGVSTNANINIFNSKLHDNGKGIYTAGNVNVEGTTLINDDLYLMGDNSGLTVTGQIRGVATPADVTFNKKVSGSGTSTFTFSSGTVTLGSGASVDDTNLVLNNTTLNVGANNAFSNVNLTGGNSTLNLKNESTGTQTFNTLALNNDMSIGIDVDLANKTTDNITVSTEGSGAVTANGHNIIIDSIYLMTDSTNYTTNITLTEDTRFSGIYKLSNDILDHIDKAVGVSGSYTVSYKDFDALVDPNKGILVFTGSATETLATTIIKDMGESAIKAYLLPATGETVEQNLGTLSGAKLTVTGNGLADKNFVRGGDTYTGVILGDGKTQTLALNDIDEWSGFADSAIVNKSGGTLQIENVNFSGNNATDKGGAIYNEGTITNLADTYKGNTAVTIGGAVYNKGTITNAITGTFGGTGTGEGNRAKNGGAIFNDAGGTLSVASTAQFINNSSSETGTGKGGGAIYNKGTISNLGGTFKGNTSAAFGGALYNDGTITNAITGTFGGTGTGEGNSAKNGGAIYNAADRTLSIASTAQFINNSSSETGTGKGGGAIYNKGTISNLGGTFKGNTSAAFGGALYNDGTITNAITGTFGGTGEGEGNVAYKSGGAIDNYINKVISIDSTAQFINNSSLGTDEANGGGAIFNRGTVTNLAGTYTGNTAALNGGAILNNGTISNLAGTFSNNTAGVNGGAILNNGTITISNATFTGNTSGTGVNQTPNSIYNKGTINLANNATVTINDGYGSLDEAQLNINTGAKFNLNIGQGTIQANSLGQITNNGTINATFDIDLASETSHDTVSGTGVNSGTLINITDLNILNSASVMPGSSTTRQILQATNTNLQLALGISSKAIGSYNDEYDDDVAASNLWTDEFNHHVITNATKVANFSLETKTTTNDSVAISVTRTGGTETTVSLGDTLALINQNTTYASKDFTAAANNATYYVTGNLGATKGTVNINGISGGDEETVDLKGFTGFEAGNGAVALNFNNVTVGDSTLTPETSIIANVTNPNTTIGLNNVILNGKITGSGYEVTTSGNTTLNSTISGNITNSGILNSSLSNALGTLKNDGTFNLTGDLTKSISGSGSTVLQSGTTGVTDGVTVAGTLNVNNKTIGMNNSDYETLTVGKLTGNGNLTLDVNANTDSKDIIHINNSGSNSVLTITTLNLTAPTDTATGIDSYIYTKQILTGTNTGASLLLGSGAVASKYNVVDYGISRTGSTELNTNAISWNADYGGWEENGLQNNKVEIVGTDTIKYSIIKTWSGTKSYTGKSENLAIMNEYTGEGSNNRSVDFTGIFESPTSGTYTARSGLGASSAGTYTLNGVKSGTKNTTIDLNGNSGFTLANKTDLVFKNIDFTGSDTLITVGNSEATISLTDSNIQGAINRTGTVEYNITSTGSSSLQNVTGAKVANTGNLTLSGTNSLVNITNNTGSTTITGGTTNSGAITQKAIEITGGTLVATNGITTVNGITNDAINGLEVKDGAINSGISGTGSTKINGTVSLTGDNTILQSVNIAAGTFTTKASGIKGNVSITSGTLELTGGILTSNVTGSGTTTDINAGTETVTIGTGSIANDVTITSGTLESSIAKLGGTITNGSIFNVSGDLTKDIGGTGTTVLQSATVAVAADRAITGTLNANGKTIEMKDGAFKTLSLGNLTGNGNLTLDLDAQTESSDTINITSGTSNSSTITITDLNLTKPLISGDSGSYTKQIITGTTTGVTLALGESLKPPVKTAISRTGADDLTTNTISWNDTYGGWTQDGTQTETLSIVSSNSLKYDLEKAWNPKSYTSKIDNLAAINQYTGAGDDNRTFNFSTKNDIFNVTESTGVTTSGKLTVNGKTDGETSSTINFNSYNGFELNNNNTEIVLKNVEIKNSSALVSGNATSGVKVVLNTVNVHDNGTGITTAGNVEIKGKSDISDNILVTGANSKIDIDASNEINLNSNLTGSGTSTLSISNGTVNLNNSNISGFETTLQDTNLNIAHESYLNGLNTTFNGTNNVNIANGNIGTLSLGNVSLNGVLKMQVDADLANAQMDKLSATGLTAGPGGRIEVSKINLLSPTSQTQLDLLFTDNSDIAGLVNYTGEGQIAYSPIFKYNTSYSQKSDGSGYFSFVSAGKKPDDFNPAILTSSVNAVVSGYQNQMQAMYGGFYHMDRYMKLSDKQRFAAENYNKFASLAPVTDLDVIKKVPETSQAVWTIPYSTFESINFKGGLRVNNIGYGMTAGGDSNMFDMGHGFKGVASGYVGYNGNHITYDGITMQQNGGFLGATLNAYKGNFFTGLTISAGASTGDADTMYGRDTITMLMAGVANKTGYNFEFLNGKLIVQPSLFMGYSWINTFDYTNSAGVRMNQDALNALQIAPGLKIIGNTESGWQPYAGVDMIWNIFMGRNQVRANDVTLPKLSEDPYIQYGLGIQKTWADKFTGFLQAMVRNGGRNGVVLSAGFRWALGHSDKNKKQEFVPVNVKTKRTIIK